MARPMLFTRSMSRWLVLGPAWTELVIVSPSGLRREPSPLKRQSGGASARGGVMVAAGAVTERNPPRVMFSNESWREV
jgi:hypothetical protein